jgi:hypothetical protein
VRKDLASALVHGSQTLQIDLTGSQGNAIAYGYTGTPNVVTVLNANRFGVPFEGVIPVNALMQPNTTWRDRISRDVFNMTPQGLPLTVPAVPANNQSCSASGRCGLRVLENISE